MRKGILILSALMIVSSVAFGAKPKKKSKKEVEPVAPVVVELTDFEKESYALGNNVGKGYGESLRRSGIEFNAEMLAKGLVEGLKGDNALTQEEMEAAFKRVDEKAKEFQAKAVEEAKSEGINFLNENKTKEGVMTTESGIQYKIITLGTGEKPKETDNVKVHYEGTLIDGTVFDSSIKRGEPITFPLNQVIKGWTEGVQLMPKGSKFIFWIPSELGYGAQGAGQQIKPYSTLVFEIELIDINPKENGSFIIED